jgi:uncharacterized protein YdbL (DUF1318 family)
MVAILITGLLAISAIVAFSVIAGAVHTARLAVREIGQELAGYLQASGGRPDRRDVVDRWNDGIQRWKRQVANNDAIVGKLNVALEELRKEARRMPTAP